MLQVYISVYLKSFLNYGFLISDTCHPDTVYLHEQGYEDLRLFAEVERVREQKSSGNAELGLLNGTVIISDDIASCNILLKNESVWIRKQAVLLFGVVAAFS
jgi:hypothetical protein